MQPGLFDKVRTKTKWRPPAAFPSLKAFPRLGFDTETTGTDPFRTRPVGFSLCLPAGADRRQWRRYYFPFAHQGGGNLDEEVVRRWAKAELRDKDLVGLNAKFDLHEMKNWKVDLEAQGCRFHDVAFNAALLNEKRYSGLSLESLAVEYLEEDERKVTPCHVPPHEFWKASAGEIAPRAEQDAYLALRLDAVTRPRLEAEDLLRVLDLEDALIPVTAAMERNGALIDRPKLERWRHEAQAKYEKIILEIFQATGIRVNPDTPADLRRLFNALQLLFPVSESGTTTFDEAALKEIHHPLIHKVLQARKLKSLGSKYLDKYLRLLDANNLLRFSLHQLRGDEYGTITGRYSSANVNIQQVPKVEKQVDDNFVPEFIIRELFIPAPGKWWLQADASQIEFRIFAHYSGSRRLIQAYNENPDTDFHQIVTDMITRIMPIKRRQAKHINFGKVYGTGRDKNLEQLMARGDAAITREQADLIYDSYEQEFPEAGRLLRKASDIAKRRGYVKTFLGRRRRFQPGDRFYSALNCVIQGTAADINKLKLLEVYQERQALGLTMRLTVHDEIDGDLEDPQRAVQAKQLLDRPCLPLRVPITWDVKVGKNWRE